MSIDIFISYARDDARKHPQIMLAESALAKAGYAVWRDDKLPAGEAYPYELARTVEAARLVIVFWGPTSVASQWVYEEAERGKRAGKLLPVMLAQVTIPMGFGLLQAIDLEQWSGDLSAPAFAQLKQAIVDRIGPPPAEIEGLTLLPVIQEHLMHQHGWGFDEAAALGPGTRISELVDQGFFLPVDDPDWEGVDREDIALWYLTRAIANVGYIEFPDCELPPMETLGDLLRFLAPYEK